jgi:hypothetical protein
MMTAMRWSVPAAPHGVVLAADLRGLDERALWAPGGGPAIYALDDGGGWHPERVPLIVVHGLDGPSSNLQAVVDRYRRSRRYQPCIVAYDDRARRASANADLLAGELLALAERRDDRGALVIVAHSMAGIIVRRALGALASVGGIAGFDAVDAVCVDTPWHGFPGPEDGLLMDVARPFIPDGFEDLRARAPLLQTLQTPPLPPSARLALVFAAHGDVALDYTESPLTALAERLAARFADDAPMIGEPRLLNFWHALLDSDAYDAFAGELRDLADADRVDAVAVAAALLRHYPRFPGDHLSVLREQPGGRGFLDWLVARQPP